MARNDEYQFVSTDSSTVIANLVNAYQQFTDRTLQPADPERLVLSWIADAIVKGLVRVNYVGNQNIPSRAEGENLDALGEWIYSLVRKDAQVSTCTVRFHIIAPQSTAITIPAGTRVTDKSQVLTWATTVDTLIPIGSTYIDVKADCDTPGVIGNGYVIGQIDTLVDKDNIMFFDYCENITETDGGTDKQDDETYFQAMRRVLDSFSTAGAEGAYIFWAKSVSDEITDVKAVRPREQTKVTCDTFPKGEDRYAFVGGNYIIENTINVYAHGSSTPAALGTDYYIDYSNNLLTIKLRNSGGLISADQIDVEFTHDLAGHVYIYALMQDGEIATSTIKDEIYKACNQDMVRPLTDYVAVKDPEVVLYDIDFTYYISVDAQISLTDIEIAIKYQIDRFIKWQYAKLGRDINVSMLENMLMQTGVKRVVIRSPTFTHLRSGDTYDVPQVAHIRNINYVNGGYEDE